MTKGNRLDVELVERKLAESRTQAQAFILSGEVKVNNQVVTKASALVEPMDDILVQSRQKYVSRGGLKLEKAIEVFKIFPRERICADFGASTGGFTDCLLQNGASMVYSIDVGYGQLDYRLREDPRVIVMERTNARKLTKQDFPRIPSLITIDVSFISLELILPVVAEVLQDEGEVVALIKPQFEAGKQQVGKNGVVRDQKIHKAVCTKIMHFAQNIGFCIMGLDYSPIRGPKGNVEFLLYLKKIRAQSEIDLDVLAETVIESIAI